MLKKLTYILFISLIVVQMFMAIPTPASALGWDDPIDLVGWDDPIDLMGWDDPID